MKNTYALILFFFPKKVMLLTFLGKKTKIL